MKKQKSAQTKQDMIRNVEDATANALLALRHLEQSLVQARFQEGQDAYVTMCKTLLGQRIWSLDKNNEKIESNFSAIGDVSNHIVEILKPYVTHFEKLSQLIAETRRQEKQNVDLSPEQTKVIDALASETKPLSITRLRAKVRMGRQKLDKLIDELSQVNLISQQTQNGRRWVHLTE
jgi:predicted transcriptional regulator